LSIKATVLADAAAEIATMLESELLPVLASK
jgi:hypothetical protein